MDKKMPVFYFSILLMVIASLGVFYGHVAMHEDAHVQIFRSYGVQSDWHYTLRGGVTSISNLSQANLCNENCEDLHELNEIIGYNVITIVLAIFGAAIILITFFSMRDYNASS
jgi:hypothetical protein